MPSTPLPTPEDEGAPQTLVDEVRAELAAAGLPVLPDDCADLGVHVSGVLIEPGDDVEPETEGVWVSWQINSPLADASRRAFKVGAYRSNGTGGFESHPAMHHWGVVYDAMNDALDKILRSLGYDVQLDADEYRTGELLVSARVPGPHWRDPAVPPLAGSAGYMPGVQVRLVAGEFTGSVTTVVSGKYRLSASSGPPLQYVVEHPNGEGHLTVSPEDVTLAVEETET